MQPILKIKEFDEYYDKFRISKSKIEDGFFYNLLCRVS
jgi:hypothetical protein